MINTREQIKHCTKTLQSNNGKLSSIKNSLHLLIITEVVEVNKFKIQ